MAASTPGCCVQVKCSASESRSVGRAQPLSVARDRPQLADLEHGRNLLTSQVKRCQCVTGGCSWDQILRLQLLAAARHGPDAEVRKPLVPRTRSTTLLRAVLRILPRNGMTGTIGRLRSLKPAGDPSVPDPLLHPDLLGHAGLPGREDADAVPRREDSVDLVRQRREGQILVDRRRDVIGRDQLELHGGDDAEAAERHDHAVEILVASTEGGHLTRAGHHLQPGHGGGQRLQSITRSVRPRRACPRHGQVRERGQVGQGPAGSPQPSSHLSVGQPRRNRQQAGPLVELQTGRQGIDAHEVPRGVGDRAEGVPAADGSYGVGAPDDQLQLFHRGRTVEAVTRKR